MEKPRGTFAPHWLAMTILDDKKSLANVESFMEPKGKIPKHLHGRLIVVNDTTNEEHLCADRYSSIIVFLASHWSITNCRFRLVGYQYVDQKRVDTTIPTSSLESMGKPSLFMQALQMGEEAWRMLSVCTTTKNQVLVGITNLFWFLKRNPINEPFVVEKRCLLATFFCICIKAKG
jgi:uncharacterized protein YcgL (UPF0745 family)